MSSPINHGELGGGKVKGRWRYLYRAVDKTGQTIDFLLTEQRDRGAALRFLTKAICRHGVPATITINGSEANTSAIWGYNEADRMTIAIRQVRYRNNLVEQDHHGVKRIIRPGARAHVLCDGAAGFGQG